MSSQEKVDLLLEQLREYSFEDFVALLENCDVKVYIRKTCYFNTKFINGTVIFRGKKGPRGQYDIFINIPPNHTLRDRVLTFVHEIIHVYFYEKGILQNHPERSVEGMTQKFYSKNASAFTELYKAKLCRNRVMVEYLEEDFAREFETPIQS